MNTIKEPLISIITVSYNVVNSIEETILSIINQNFKDFEFIIIDGGSTDGTIDIIKKYQDKITFWVSEPDKGIYDAMNKGVKLAKGEWVNFMNAGDSFFNLEVLSNLKLQDLLDFQVVYGSINCITKTNSFILKPKSFREINNKMIFCHQAAFVKKSILNKFNFDLNFKIAGDYKLFRSLYIDGYLFKEKDLVIANYDAEGGISSTRFYEMFKEYAMIIDDWNSVNVKIKVVVKSLNYILFCNIRKIIPIKSRLLIKKIFLNFNHDV